MEFGYGMQGIEERVLILARAMTKKFDEITYVEIGVGEGPTLTAIACELRDHAAKKWRAIGVELPNGYSFNRQKVIDFASSRNLKLDFVTPNGTMQHPKWDQVTVFLKDSQTFLTEMWADTIQFALIDGCHGRPCVIQDFLAVEAFMSKGGLVMFHDYGTDQIGHYQPHCPTGLDVRGAVQELGLTNGRRKGWAFRGELIANKPAGGWDMGVFQKEID